MGAAHVELVPTRHAARVTLVRPPALVFVKSLSTSGPIPPLGVAYLAAALRQVGHHVSLIDAVGEGIDQAYDFESPVGVLRRIGLSPREVVDRIPPDTQVLGLSQMFLHEWPDTREIARLARARLPDATIITGGENATAFATWVFQQSPEMDAVASGEGEMTLIEVADRVAAGTPLHGIAGLTLRPERAAGATAATLPVRIRNLEALPRPAWDLVPLENYWTAGSFLGVERGRSIPVLGTRGCPYRCSFCSSPQMWTTRYVTRDPADLVDEIASYVGLYGIENFDFCDLTAITQRSWTLDLCDELDARNLSLTWQLPIGTRSEALDPEVLLRLKRTGCRNITYSPESGSQRMLERWDKRLDIEHLMGSVAEAKRLGMVTHVNTIIGHPDERYLDLAKTWLLLLRAAVAGCDSASPIMFCPYPGSADFAKLVDDGRLVVDEAFIYVALSRGSGSHRSYNRRMPAPLLRFLHLAIVLTFYGTATVRHPTRLLHHLRVVRGKEGESDLVDMLFRVKRRSILGSGTSAPPGEAAPHRVGDGVREAAV